MEHPTQPDDAAGRGGAVRVAVRYWAGAEAAAGCSSEHLTLASAEPPRGVDLRRAVIGAHPGIAPVLRRCSLLQSGRRLDDHDLLAPDEQVEVLPPFVGG